jgi:hypothetical protein
MACIFGNTLTMEMQHFGQSDGLEMFMFVTNSLFSTLFLLEAITKICAFGRFYFHEYWNRFDFFIVCCSIVAFVIRVNGGGKAAQAVSVLRILRMARIVKLLQEWKGLRALVQGVMQTLPALMNVSMLMALMIFIYAVMGMQLFGLVGNVSDTHAHFRAFAPAMLLLLRCSTGEAWNTEMHAFMAQPEGCMAQPEWGTTLLEDGEEKRICHFQGADPKTCLSEDPATGVSAPCGCGASSAMTYAFFLSFTVTVTFVSLNLFIAVVVDGFSEAMRQQQSKAKRRWRKAIGNVLAQGRAAKSTEMMRKMRAFYAEEMEAEEAAAAAAAEAGLGVDTQREGRGEGEGEDEPDFAGKVKHLLHLPKKKKKSSPKSSPEKGLLDKEPQSPKEYKEPKSQSPSRRSPSPEELPTRTEITDTKRHKIQV